MPAVGGVRERVLEFLAQYGERGYAVLRAALEAYASAGGRGVRLGDFSYREVVARLKAWGIEYNPSMLLRILERDYGVVETSYRSGNQHWYRFIDAEAVAEALEEYDRGASGLEEAEEGPLDPEVEVLRLQIASLGVGDLVEELRRLSAKPSLGRAERLRLRRLAFEDMELVARLLRRAEELGYRGPEVELLVEALRLARRLSARLLGVERASVSAARGVERLARLGSRARLGTGKP